MKKNLIKVGNYELQGFVSDEKCTKCGQNKVYYDKYDTLFCPDCNVWLESRCSDPNCENCSTRPDKPLPIE